MDVELVDLDRMGWIDALPHGDGELVTLLDNDPRSVVRLVVLVVVVARGDGACLRSSDNRRKGGGREGREDDEGALGTHVPYTISAEIKVVAKSAMIPQVIHAMSPTACARRK